MRTPKILVAASTIGLFAATAITGIIVVVLSGGSHAAQPAVAPSGVAWTGDTYQDQLADLRARQTAKLNAATVDCMAKAGFTYVVPTPAASPRNALSPRDDLLRYGYGVNTAPVIPPAADPNASYLASLPADRRAAYQVALHGSATATGTANSVAANSAKVTGGCVAVGNDRYLRGLSVVISRFTAAREQMYQQLSADPRIVRVHQQWTACLATAGYSYATPQAIIDYLTRDTTHGVPGSPQAQAHELAVARADSDCRDRYVQSTYQAVLTEYLARSVANDRQLLAEATQAASQS